MSSPARSRGLRKAGRDVFQAVLATIAAGGTAVLIDLIVGSVDPVIGIVIGVAYKIIFAYAQNTLEANGTIPVVLPTPGLLTTGKSDAVVTKVVGTVDAITGPATKTGTKIVGDVVTTAGGVVGTVTGTAKGVLRGVEDLGGV